MSKATEMQIGEDKYESPYRSFAIQPVEFLTRNNIGWCEANAIKYLCRHKMKNGREDVLKAKHYIDLLLELEYENKDVPEGIRPDTGQTEEKREAETEGDYREPRGEKLVKPEIQETDHRRSTAISGYN